MPETIRLYELVYIIAPDRSEEQVQAVIEKYNNLIASQGGSVEKTDIWERRRLAYEINGYNEGLYVVTIFHAAPGVEAELRRVFRISEDTLRSIIVRPGEETTLPEPSPAPRAGAEEGGRRGPRGQAAGRAPQAEQPQAVQQPQAEQAEQPQAEAEGAPEAPAQAAEQDLDAPDEAAASEEQEQAEPEAAATA